MCTESNNAITLRILVSPNRRLRALRELCVRFYGRPGDSGPARRDTDWLELQARAEDTQPSSGHPESIQHIQIVGLLDSSSDATHVRIRIE